jgi:hypothetical protein
MKVINVGLKRPNEIMTFFEEKLTSKSIVVEISPANVTSFDMK